MTGSNLLPHCILHIANIDAPHCYCHPIHRKNNCIRSSARFDLVPYHRKNIRRKTITVEHFRYISPVSMVGLSVANVGKLSEQILIYERRFVRGKPYFLCVRTESSLHFSTLIDSNHAYVTTKIFCAAVPED